MERLLILDGNSLLNRAFYALPLMNNSEGVHTNAVYGFTNMLLKMKEEFNPDYIVSTFDKKAPTFRHLEYGEYKAGRKKMPPELAEQFPIVKELLKLLSINIYELDGFEADDLIGTLAKYAEKNGIEVYIVSGDRDALQLASKNINVVFTKKGVTETEIYNEDRMINELGVTPTQFIDVKGLMGDKSDNIPGVPGVGEKTAYKLIQTYGSIEEVLNNIDSISGKKLKENLEENREQAIFSKKLATIKTDVPMEINLDEIKSNDNYDKEGLRKLLFKLQMKSVVSKLNLDENKEAEELKYDVISNINELQTCVNNIDGEVFIHYSLEDENVYSNIKIDRLVLNINDRIVLVNIKEIMKNEADKCIEILRGLFEDKNTNKICYKAKELLRALSKLNISMNNLEFDIEIAAYLIDSSKGKYPISTLVNEYIGEDIQGSDEEVFVKEGKYLRALYLELKKKIEEESMNELYYNIELPLVKVLASMEALGFKVNKDKLEEIGEKLKVEIDRTQNEIYELSEEEFNINSPKQLGKILFEKLDLPVVKKTKTGYSTSAEVLEKLSDKHPIIEKIMYYRQITKLYSTYIEGLKNVIDVDECIHSNFNQTVTTTGRLSSTEPNLQNIPIKYEMGREIRKVFIPMNDDCVLLSADYSQIELRVLADMAGDTNMIDAFNHHSDIHTKTASEVFGVPVEEVTSLMRSNAKAVNFGIVYGISDFSLAQDLKITKKEAAEYMNIYFERYPRIKEYLNETVEKAKSDGYVLTILNRRRFIPEIKASNKIVKALGERLAMNAPIQGSAADIIKIAMVNVYNKLNELNLKSRILLQVHDELILNVYNNELDKVKALVKEEMENVLKLKVKLEVDMNVGKTWYDSK